MIRNIRSGIQVRIASSLTFKPDYDTETITIDLYLLAVTIGGSDKEGKPAEETHKRTVSTSLPMATFPNEAALTEWAQKVCNEYSKTVSEMMMISAADQFALVGNVLLAGMGFEAIDLKTYVDEAARFRAKDTKEVLGLSVVGKYSAWKKNDLERVLRQILVKLPRECRTKKKAAEKLREKYPDIAPKNGASLHQLMRRLEIDWMRLKSVK